MVCSTLLSFAQSNNDIREDRHIFDHKISLIQTQFDGSPMPTGTGITAIMENNWLFTIENVLSNDYIIQIAKFTSGSSTAQSLNSQFYRNSSNENIYFKLSKADYKTNAQKLSGKGTFIVGASTTLVKIRPGNGKDEEDENVIYSEFGNDFNIGLTAGWRFTPNRKRDFSVAGVGGISFSAIKVTPQTTRDFITSESTQSAITFSAGLIFEIEKFQLSAFGGIDAMSGEIGKNWIYRNRPWIGIGFGYEIFKAKSSN